MKTKATDALLTDHKLINKVLESFVLDNPRFPHICQTLHRSVLGHAWFEDEIFLPAMRAEPLVSKRLNDEIAQEHQDIDHLLKMVRQAAWEPTPNPMAVDRWGRDQRYAVQAYAKQLRALLRSHFLKEEEGWFPLAEHILTEEHLIELGDEMKRRQGEIRKFIEV